MTVFLLSLLQQTSDLWDHVYGPRQVYLTEVFEGGMTPIVFTAEKKPHLAKQCITF